MRKFEKQSDGKNYCKVVGHPEDCDCGIDPDHEYERRVGK